VLTLNPAQESAGWSINVEPYYDQSDPGWNNSCDGMAIALVVTPQSGTPVTTNISMPPVNSSGNCTYNGKFTLPGATTTTTTTATGKSPLDGAALDGTRKVVLEALDEENKVREDILRNTGYWLTGGRNQMRIAKEDVREAIGILDRYFWQGPTPIPDLDTVANLDDSVLKVLDKGSFPLAIPARDKAALELAKAMDMKEHALSIVSLLRKTY
jgi:hypothetical protein